MYVFLIHGTELLRRKDIFYKHKNFMIWKRETRNYLCSTKIYNPFKSSIMNKGELIDKIEKDAKVKLLHLFGPSKNLIFKSDFRAITYHENLQKTVWSKIFLFVY